MIVADTSGLYAIFNRRQPEHQAARAAVERDGGPLVLSPLVLAELDYFILTRLGAKAEQAVLAELRSPAYRLAPFTDDDFKLASEVAVKYGDMQLGLTDASIMVQAARHKTARILSLDHTHFTAVRPLTGDASFTVLPRDDQPLRSRLPAKPNAALAGREPAVAPPRRAQGPPLIGRERLQVCWQDAECVGRSGFTCPLDWHVTCVDKRRRDGR